MSKDMNSRLIAVEILEQVQKNNAYADMLLDSAFKQHLFDQRDRAFITELVYGTLRWKRHLDWGLKNIYHGQWRNIPSCVKTILETGLYQILFMNKVPDHAAVNEAVNLTNEYHVPKWGKVVNGMLREALRNPNKTVPPEKSKDPAESLSIRWSHPKWVVQKWIDVLGVERADQICKANNKRPHLGIRVNPLQSTPEKVFQALVQMGVSPEPAKYLKEFFILPTGKNLVESKHFQKGEFSIQDVSAGLVSHLVDPQPGETIVDLAAAPGGKSTHLAELSQDKASIFSVDRYPARVRKIQNYKKRLGIKNIQPILGNGCHVHFKQVDKVLVDAPCSGMGTIQRRGEMRWRRKEDDLPDLIALQKNLLHAAASLLQPNGVLVYSTCTTLSEENENLVDHFLQTHPEFQVEKSDTFIPTDLITERGFIQTWPDIHGMDGSFAVRMRMNK